MDIAPSSRQVLDNYIVTPQEPTSKPNLIKFLMRDKYIAFKKTDTLQKSTYLLVPMEFIYEPINKGYYSFH